MPAVPLNYWAILAGALASMMIGALWYGPLFGKQWIAWSGMSHDQIEKSKAGGMGKSYALMFVGSLVMSYVFAHALVFASSYLKVEGVSAGLMAGFWNWLGFIAPVTMGSVLWDAQPWKLWVLNNGFQLLQLLVIGVILALWK